jgi:hypothetical protein
MKILWAVRFGNQSNVRYRIHDNARYLLDKSKARIPLSISVCQKLTLLTQTDIFGILRKVLHFLAQASCILGLYDKVNSYTVNENKVRIFP